MSGTGGDPVTHALEVLRGLATTRGLSRAVAGVQGVGALAGLSPGQSRELAGRVAEHAAPEVAGRLGRRPGVDLREDGILSLVDVVRRLGEGEPEEVAAAVRTTPRAPPAHDAPGEDLSVDHAPATDRAADGRPGRGSSRGGGRARRTARAPRGPPLGGRRHAPRRLLDPEGLAGVVDPAGAVRLLRRGGTVLTVLLWRTAREVRTRMGDRWRRRSGRVSSRG